MNNDPTLLASRHRDKQVRVHGCSKNSNSATMKENRKQLTTGISERLQRWIEDAKDDSKYEITDNYASMENSSTLKAASGEFGHSAVEYCNGVPKSQRRVKFPNNEFENSQNIITSNSNLDNWSKVTSHSPSSSVSTLPESEDDLLDSLELPTRDGIGKYLNEKIYNLTENDFPDFTDTIRIERHPFRERISDDDMERTLICTAEAFREAVLKKKPSEQLRYDLNSIAKLEKQDNYDVRSSTRFKIPHYGKQSRISSENAEISNLSSYSKLRSSKSMAFLKESRKARQELSGRSGLKNSESITAKIDSSQCIKTSRRSDAIFDSFSDLNISQKQSSSRTPKEFSDGFTSRGQTRLCNRFMLDKLYAKGSRSSRRTPILIQRSEAKDLIKKKNGMEYDSENYCWRGNEEFGKAFEQALWSPPRPKLISKTHVNLYANEVSSGMHFDEKQLRWVKKDPDSDEDDPFKDFEELQDDFLILDPKSGSRIRRSADDDLSSSGHFAVGKEFDLEKSWIDSERRNERVWRAAVDGWIFESGTIRNKGKYWEIRSLLLDQVI